MAAAALDRLTPVSAAELVDVLRRSGLSIALAESCTGGAALAELTRIAGASACVWGGVVVYSDAAKQELAGVPQELLAAKGPVSASVSAALAEGVRGRAQTDLGGAVTGWAGPTSAGPDPAGTVYLAVASDRRTWTQRHCYPGGRLQVRSRAVKELLAMVAVVAAEIQRGRPCSEA